ncbi:MAG: FAD-dependent oxidoreductase [Anaerolineae bacterium]|nr:FAD-dependent oxidoreductase [Anaerolineae bacterium]
MGTVPAALAKHLDIKLSAEVHRIDMNDDGSVTLRIGSPAGQADLTADYVVLATPAPVTLRLLPNPESVLGKIVTDFLGSTRYVRNATTAVAYRTAPETRAYGVSVPTVLNHRLAAIGWDHLKGINRSPAGTGLGVMMPTNAHTDTLWERSKSEIGEDLIGAADELYPGSRAHVMFYRVQHWSHAMPLQAPGWARQLAQALAVKPNSPVFTCGDYWGGPNTEMALVSGERAAAQLLAAHKAKQLQHSL